MDAGDQGLVAIIVAVLALIGSVAAAVSAGRSAKSAAETAGSAARFVATSDRYADWQMHKRKVYSELLSAIRAAQAEESPAATTAMKDCFDVALLAADAELGKQLRALRREIEPEGEQPLDEDLYIRTVAGMKADVDGTATDERAGQRGRRRHGGEAVAG